MAEVLGGIMRALGTGLSVLYTATHSYPAAIILLTLGVRAALLPLTLKSTRSMAAMQRAQPEIKKVQDKYKALQRKARDRAEVQQIRMEMQTEMNAVMRAHGASLGGGCLPQIAQFPVLIAMFSVMRAAIPVAMPPTPAPVPAQTFNVAEKGSIVCRPTDPQLPTDLVSGPTPMTITCSQEGKEPVEIRLDASKMVDGHTNQPVASAPWIVACTPVVEDDGSASRFGCRSALGTGHLPKDGELFRDVSEDKATLFGMHPGCTATQVGSKENAAQCTRDPNAGGGGKAFPYYLLIGLVAYTSYYSGRQMNKRTLAQGGQITQQQQMMQWMMPAVFALISINLPAGSNLYFLVANLWQIGQQHVQFTRLEPRDKGGSEPNAQTPVASAPLVAPEPQQPAPRNRPQQGSKKRKRKRKKKR